MKFRLKLDSYHSSSVEAVNRVRNSWKERLQVGVAPQKSLEQPANSQNNASEQQQKQ